VELDARRVELREGEPLDRAVVERDVRLLHAFRRRDGEAVVLARHEHASTATVEHGVICAPVAERQLDGLVVGREPE
jgi:hypothetical protein